MKRKKSHEEEENHERWLVSYADFITLLFAFFTILYATSERNLEKTEEFQESIKKYLTKDGGLGGILSGGAAGSKSEVNRASEFNSPIKPPLPTFATTNSRVSQALESVEQFVEDELSEEDVKEAVFDISTTEYGVRLSLSASDIFSEGSAQLRSRALSLVDKVAKMIQQMGYAIWVESYTSDKPLSESSYPSHWELASARSTTVIRYFSLRHRLSFDRMAALSYGAARPLVPNDSPENRKRNERLDILILSEGEPL